MSESTNNGRPVPPAQVSGKGKAPVSENGIVPFSEPQKPQAQVPVYFGYLLCVLGAACITLVPVLGAALAACGVTVVLWRSGFKFGCLAALLALGGTTAMGLALDPPSLADALPACVASIGTAFVLSQNKMTPGIGCIIVALLMMSQLGGAALVAASVRKRQQCLGTRMWKRAARTVRNIPTMAPTMDANSGPKNVPSR